MSETKFFRCSHCGNIIAMVHDSGVPVICCGEPMQEIKPNTTDAAQEKHVPVVEVKGNTVTVRIGSVAHPMVDVHYIEWICLETAQGRQRKALKPGMEPAAVFALTDGEKPIKAFAYCNLHGLWSAEV